MSLSFNTLSIGKVLIQKSVCTSTNDECKLLLSKSKPIEGTAIITDHQTQGRGQFGNVWQANEGENLLLSIILFPTFLQANEQFYLSKIVSLACVKTCESIVNHPFEVKWPNDIYCKGKKVAGILIENQLAGSKLSASIIGVGLNVNQQNFDGLDKATSLSIMADKILNRNEVLTLLFENIDALYIQLRHKKFELIDAAYHSKMLGYNESLMFKDKNGLVFSALVKGVNQAGQLILQKENAILLFNFKEVKWLI